MTSWVLYRHYVVFGLQYFWVFHYGRPALKALSRLLPSAPSAAASGWRVLPLLCLAAAVALETLDVTVLGSSTYYHVLEEWRGGGGGGSGGNDGGGSGQRLPQFFMVTFILLLLTLLVVALAYAATGWRKPPKAVRRMGSTTLGCYVMHWYFMPITGYLNEPWAAGEGQSPFGNLPKHLGATAGFVVQVVVLLGAPMLFQVTLGAAFHKLLLWQFKGVVRVGPLLAACARRCCGPRRGMGRDDKEPLTPGGDRL